MSHRYNFRRTPDKRNVPWQTSASGLRVGNRADVPQFWTLTIATTAVAWRSGASTAGVGTFTATVKDTGCPLPLQGSPYSQTGYILKPIGKPVPTFKNGKPRPPESSD